MGHLIGRVSNGNERIEWCLGVHWEQARNENGKR